MQNITATHINYHQICARKLWLFSHAIQMEHTSDLVAEGKLIGENTYMQRAERYTEIELSFDTEQGHVLFFGVTIDTQETIKGEL